jgi:hypothetical protein
MHQTMVPHVPGGLGPGAVFMKDVNDGPLHIVDSSIYAWLSRGSKASGYSSCLLSSLSRTT